MASYQVRTGWRRPMLHFDNEPAAADAWNRCRYNADAGFWILTNDGERFGTRDATSERRDSDLRHLLHSCQECQHDFFSPATGIEPLCPGCAMIVRPAEDEPTRDGLVEARHRREKRWRREHFQPPDPQDPDDR